MSNHDCSRSGLVVPSKTMSSVEIATLTGKRHTHVMDDCRKLIEFYAKSYSTEKAAEMVKVSAYKDSTGRSLPCFELTRDASLDLVTGYSLPHRHAVNQRWLELESAPRQTSPAELTREQILIMALESERERLRLESENAALRPKAEFHDEIAQGAGEFTFTEVVATVFNRSIPVSDLKSWAIRNGWLQKSGKLPTKWAMTQGLMRQRPFEKNGMSFTNPVVTGKGMTLIRHLYRRNELFTADIGPESLMLPAKA